MSNTAEKTFDPTDPHGFHAKDTHGHVILSPMTLIGVLVALIIFTVLTVFASRFEVWLSEAFQWEIPQSVNVAIAMSIAVIKGLLVLMFFMQLRYDTPLNSIIFGTCLLAFGCFIGFTALDLFTRDSIDRARSGEIKAGGLAAAHTRYEQVFNEKTGQWERRKVDISVLGLPVAERAKIRERGPDEQRVSAHHDEPAPLPTADRTVRLTGLHLFAIHDEHGGDGHAEDGHAEVQGDDHANENQDGHADDLAHDPGG